MELRVVLHSEAIPSGRDPFSVFNFLLNHPIGCYKDRLTVSQSLQNSILSIFTKTFYCIEIIMLRFHLYGSAFGCGYLKIRSHSFL